MGFNLEILEVCVCVFCLNFHFVAGFDFKYIHFVFCYVCHVLHSPKSKISCSRENEFV